MMTLIDGTEIYRGETAIAEALGLGHRTHDGRPMVPHLVKNKSLPVFEVNGETCASRAALDVWLRERVYRSTGKRL